MEDIEAEAGPPGSSSGQARPAGTPAHTHRGPEGTAETVTRAS